MLDNFSLESVKRGVLICKEKGYNADIEISGGITLENIHYYRDLDIQRIAIGQLTHSVKALDLSVLIYDWYKY